MKKRFFGLIAILVLSLTLFTALIGCTSLSAEEKEVVGTYELVEISIVGYPHVNKNTYEYFSMEFKSNKKCVLKSKAGLTVYEAEASWKINSDGELEVITRKGFATAIEKYKYEDGYISGTNTDLLEGVSITMTIKMKKIVE